MARTQIQVHQWDFDEDLQRMAAAHIKADLHRRQQQLRERLDKLFNPVIYHVIKFFYMPFGFPWFDITIGAYLDGYRIVRWSYKNKAWFIVIASDLATRRPIGYAIRKVM